MRAINQKASRCLIRPVTTYGIRKQLGIEGENRWVGCKRPCRQDGCNTIQEKEKEEDKEEKYDDDDDDENDKERSKKCQKSYYNDNWFVAVKSLQRYCFLILLGSS